MKNLEREQAECLTRLVDVVEALPLYMGYAAEESNWLCKTQLLET